MTPPAVSIILPVYNNTADVGRAIACMLEQTFTDFELIVINDGSPNPAVAPLLDHIGATAQTLRLRIVHLEKNRGLCGALNAGIAMAKGHTIARQDQDDISQPSRLAKQVAFLNAHPRCGMVGTRAEIWIGNQPDTRYHDHPAENSILQFDLLFNNPFVHSSMLIRKAVFETVGGYATDRARQPPEDYELWSRVARRFEVANIPERLVAYREVPHSMSRDGTNPFLKRLILISSENIAHRAGLAAPDHAARIAAALAHAAYDEVPTDADIDASCAIVARAADAIVAEAPSGQRADLLLRKTAAISALRHHHAICTRVPKVMWRYVPALQRLRMPAVLKRLLLGNRV